MLHKLRHRTDADSLLKETVRAMLDRHPDTQDAFVTAVNEVGLYFFEFDYDTVYTGIAVAMRSLYAASAEAKCAEGVSPNEIVDAFLPLGRTNVVDVHYVTDRVPKKDSEDIYSGEWREIPADTKFAFTVASHEPPPPEAHRRTAN